MSNQQIYQSPEWQSLSHLDRAQLLLVIEGLKRGAMVKGDWTNFMGVLEKTGLDYEPCTDKYSLNPVFRVARTEDLDEANRRYLTLPENATGADYDRIEGWLLGYPECCTEEYVKERTPEQESAAREGQHHLSYKFGQELDEKIRAEGNYPDVFDYSPPAFTPCGINCPEAAEALKAWKEAIERLDPEAGRELASFNRGGNLSPYHQETYPERTDVQDVPKG